MVYYIIIRGPAGVGKSSVVDSLVKKINGVHIFIDKILDKKRPEEGNENITFSQKSFFNANEVAVDLANKYLKEGKPVVFDGNFFWTSQIEDLIHRITYKHYVFTLKADFEICVERDKARGKNKIGRDAVKVTFDKVSSFYGGDVINTNKKTSEEVAQQIFSQI